MKIKLISTGISVFFERLAQTIENTRFSMMRFLHLYVINHKKDMEERLNG